MASTDLSQDHADRDTHATERPVFKLMKRRLLRMPSDALMGVDSLLLAMLALPYGYAHDSAT